MFLSNNGRSIFIMFHAIFISGKMLLKGNKGSSIASQNSTIIFSKNCCANFQNSAADHGGALYSIHSTILFKDDCNVTFIEKRATSVGGAIHCFHSLITFTDHSTGMFSLNRATFEGGGGGHSSVC